MSCRNFFKFMLVSMLSMFAIATEQPSLESETCCAKVKIGTMVLVGAWATSVVWPSLAGWLPRPPGLASLRQPLSCSGGCLGVDHHLHHERGTAPQAHWHHRASFGCNRRFGVAEALPSRVDTSQGVPVDSEDMPRASDFHDTESQHAANLCCQASFRMPFAEVAARPAKRICTSGSSHSKLAPEAPVTVTLNVTGESAKPGETSQVSFEQWPQAFSKPTALACNPEKPSVRQCKYS